MNKQTRNFIIGVVIVVGILVGMVKYAEYKVAQEETQYDVNGFDFTYDPAQKLWFTKIQLGPQPYDIPFHYHPNDLNDVIVEQEVGDIIWLNRPENIIIAVPPDASTDVAIAGIEVSKITGERFQVLKIPTTSAVSEFMEGYPFANCSLANERTVVIEFRRSAINAVSSEGRCIILDFQQNNSIRVADAFVYNLLKIK